MRRRSRKDELKFDTVVLIWSAVVLAISVALWVGATRTHESPVPCIVLGAFALVFAPTMIVIYHIKHGGVVLVHVPEVQPPRLARGKLMRLAWPIYWLRCRLYTLRHFEAELEAAGMLRRYGPPRTKPSTGTGNDRPDDERPEAGAPS